MDLDKQLGFDADLAENGVWIVIDDDGAELKLAAMPNPAYERFLEPHQRRARQLQKDIPEPVYEECLAQTVLLDWKKITDKGVDLKPTVQNRLAMLRKYRGFKAMVLRLGTDQGNFRRETAEAEEKN